MTREKALEFAEQIADVMRDGESAQCVQAEACRVLGIVYERAYSEGYDDGCHDAHN